MVHVAWYLPLRCVPMSSDAPLWFSMTCVYMFMIQQLRGLPRCRKLSLLLLYLLEIAFLESLPVMPSKLRGIHSKLAPVPLSSVRGDFHGVTCGGV